MGARGDELRDITSTYHAHRERCIRRDVKSTYHLAACRSSYACNLVLCLSARCSAKPAASGVAATFVARSHKALQLAAALLGTFLYLHGAYLWVLLQARTLLQQLTAQHRPGLQAGALVAGKYQLEHLVGEGAMGAVWRARNLALDAPVAIKVLSSTANSGMLRERLLREARAAASLTHPAIVKVFDVDQTAEGDPFIVMELLQGRSLGTLLSMNGPLSDVQAVRLLLPIADALRVAHDKGLVHRDVKPDNICIVEAEEGVQPKLLDFGIVKNARFAEEKHLTQAGAVVGSPDYMSPEQASGEEHISLATDVWSLSVVLYEALAGRPPFDANNYNALLFQILESTPPTLRELEVADDELSAIVSRGLNKQPELRFPSMRELGGALAKWLLRQGVTDDICGTALEVRWLGSQSRPGDTGLRRTPPWLEEAASGLRPRTTPTTPAPAPTVIVRPSRRLSKRWPAAAAVASIAVLAGVLLSRSPTSTSPNDAAVRKSSGAIATSLVTGGSNEAATVRGSSSPVEAPAGITPETLSVDPVRSAAPTSAPMRGSLQRQARPPALRAQGKPKRTKDLLLPYE
jgi:eukaryotic-like serine/threonine-protein kinase